MKLFATIFLAILAAAAAIWAVWAFNAKLARDEASRLSILESMTKSAEYTAERLAVGGIIREKDTFEGRVAWDDMDAPAEFARYAAQSLPREANLFMLRIRFVGAYRTASDLAKKNHNDRFGGPDPTTIR